MSIAMAEIANVSFFMIGPPCGCVISFGRDTYSKSRADLRQRGNDAVGPRLKGESEKSVLDPAPRSR
jgi:hypothetical protein